MNCVFSLVWFINHPLIFGPELSVAFCALGSNPMPVPDCSVVTHSDILVAPTTLTLEVTSQQANEETGSICDDPTLLKKVSLTGEAENVSSYHMTTIEIGLL